MRLSSARVKEVEDAVLKTLLWPKVRGDYRVSGRGAGTGEPTNAPRIMNGGRPRVPTGRASRLVGGHSLETQRCGDLHCFMLRRRVRQSRFFPTINTTS